MPTRRVLYLPSVDGHILLWRNLLDPEASKADEVFQFGNIIGLDEHAKDGNTGGPNMNLLQNIDRRRRLRKWVQLVGPNEIAALSDPERWLNIRSRTLLRDMWVGENPIKTAAVSRGRLLTHGGLTYGEWIDIGRPETAADAADRLNEKYLRSLYQGAAYALGDGPNYSVNPIWAHPARELYPSWITAPEALPFDQITAGGSLNNPEGRSLVTSDSCYESVDRIRYQRYGSKLEIKGQIIVSLELGLGEKRVASLPRDRQLYVENADPEV